MVFYHLLAEGTAQLLGGSKSGWGEGVACKEIEVLQSPDNLRYLGESDTRQRCTSQVLDSMNKLGLYDILCIDQSSILL